MTTDLPDIPLGRRVVLRYLLPAGYPQSMTDVIGELVGLDPLTVRGADGTTIAVASDRVVALKALGPRPIRTAEIRTLESAAADAWPGVEHAWIDGWLARAGHGVTRRANSAVPLGGPGSPTLMTGETLARIEQWYLARGLTPQLVLPDRLASAPPGWSTNGETTVLAVDLDNVVLPQGPSMVRVADAPDAAWSQLHRSQGEEAVPEEIPGSFEVLTAVRDGIAGYASLGLPAPITVGRAAVTGASDGRQWVGLSCLAVSVAHRRRGLGTLVCAELLRWGQVRGATHAYLQVEADNAGAFALYREMGFMEHHTYRYAAPGVE
ncbi:GNAT family N-acetyltransferase [Nocardia panacis]|uniref:GNAT family N-acetyltransferase n=1 Tax=Nocardia panacis TaxID=2340916 RepID=A0A3A4KA35_9NOCA|nr:GNAT family N-acetyltransferase [Nocardia panacis]RJO76680.1 GNAT family N-acetyltransferase [Nocardia panacis]